MSRHSPSPTLLVDVYQTLVDIQTSQHRGRLLEARGWDAVATQVRRAGAAITGADLLVRYRLHRDAWYAAQRNPGIRHHSFPRLLQAVLDSDLGIGITPDVLDALVTAYRRAARGHVRLYTGVKETLSALHMKYRMAVASYSQSCFAEPELRELGVAHCFEIAIYSSDVGYRKTSMYFYRRCLEAVARPAASCVMIGDNYEEDVRMPERLGMRAIWIRNPDARSSTTPAHSINSLPLARIAELPRTIDRILR